jgi:ATP diphosphatase
MRRLRDPEKGCPWDKEQTFATIAPYTIEEAYEVADAIRREAWEELRGELGDLLLQVVYHAQMAREAGLFDFDAVAHGIADKMIRRHPHVFGDAVVESAAAQRRAWEEVKAAERAREVADPSVLAGLPLALPALTRAEKLQRRAARIGFDWPEPAPILSKIEEELDEVRASLAAREPKEKLAEELGDLLFAVVNLARRLEVDAEEALRAANAKFERRFRAVEERARAAGSDPASLGLEALDRLWEEVKAGERDGSGSGGA